jgi:iron complex transport system permease protein
MRQGGPILARSYRAFTLRRVLVLGGFVAATLVSLLCDVATGPAMLSLGDVVSGILDPGGLSRAETVIVWDVRLPYAVMALLVGASLGLAGAEMQTVLNNPLASPYTLGISAAATLGASLAIAVDLSLTGLALDVAIPVSAFVFAMAATALILLFSRLYGANVDTIVLFGIAMLFAMEALVSLIQFIADSDTLQQIVFWTMGSLGRATWPKIAIVAVVLGCCVAVSATQVWRLTLLRTGDDHARALGIAVERLRLGVLIRVSLLSAVAVAFVGTIGFVGLVGPHISRMALGEDHRFFLPGAALAGAMMLSLASIASKAIVPGLILPVGIVTALAGIPIFVVLIVLQRRFG